MEKQLEVFGTKEVSIKEFMGASDKSLMLLSDFNLAKENLVALNLKHSIRVSELSENKNFDASELKELVSIRAELREPRYLIQKIEKNNVSVFESYKKKDKANLNELIELNVSLEDSVDALIKFEEKRKEIEKEAERVAEQNRIDTIEKKISDFESDSYKIIQETNIGNVELHKSMLDAFVNEEFDYEEYEIMFEQARIRVQSYWDNKCSEVKEKEQQRLENEQMKQEIFQVRIIRLKEVGFELSDNLFKSNDFDYSIDKSDMFNIDSKAFEGVLLGIKEAKEKAEQIKINAELKKQKDEQFEIRKNRLAEIGVEFRGGTFEDIDRIVFIDSIECYHFEAVYFEQILSNAKKSILEGKEQKQIAEQQRLEAIEKAEKQKAIDLELSKKDAIRLKKENAARVKRLAKDKKNYKHILTEAMDSFPKVFVLAQNDEIKEFSIEASIEVSNLFDYLLTKLNEL